VNPRDAYHASARRRYRKASFQITGSASFTDCGNSDRRHRHRGAFLIPAPSSTQSHDMTQPLQFRILVSRFRLKDLLEKRRDILRAARVLPVGAERNQLRQIVMSLRALCRNPKWLQANTADGWSTSWN
jgi:hypothetical protein